MSSRFTAEGENARRKNGRIKDKSVRNVPGPIKEEREIREGKAKKKEEAEKRQLSLGFDEL